MASADNVFPPDDRCQICGAQLEDEIIIQEFADGSLARLCAECAAGAALATEPDSTGRSGESVWPDEAGPTRQTDSDAIDKTRELLMPVVDLITLQREMQGALQRLATSLESFAAGVLTDNLDKTATVESRVQALERELELTRARLRETESLLATASPPGMFPAPAAESAPAVAEPAGEQAVDWETPSGAAFTDYEGTPLTTPTESVPTAAPLLPVAATSAPAPPVSGDQPERHGFQLAEVQAAQRYFNESPFTERMHDVRRSLGKPQANLTRVTGVEPRAFVTVAWDIVWYQYLVDLRRDIPSDQRVVLHREGMDLDELAHYFKEKNASIDDDGRLDASELEVRLLSDPSALITEMTRDEERALEDATEEIWDQHISPEFKWDD